MRKTLTMLAWLVTVSPLLALLAVGVLIGYGIAPTLGYLIVTPAALGIAELRHRTVPTSWN